MVVCKRCGKENQQHYKFCLGCGAEIVAPDADNGTAKTMHANSGASAPSGGALPGMPPATAPPAAAPPAAAPPVAAPPPAAPAAAAPEAAAGASSCPKCGFDIPPNFQFCGACGTNLADLAKQTPAPEPKPAPAPAASKSVGQLTLIRPDGSEGGTLDLEDGTNKLGRSHGKIFENDGYLSPLHAEMIVNAAGVVVRDIDSLNGVFVRLEAEHEVKPGDIFRIGQELLRYDTIIPPKPLEDGTEIMGSPNPGYWGRVSVIIGREIDGSAFPLLGDAVTFGRERGDINFPDDGYVSGLHARLASRDSKAYLTDLGSSNGTFVKIASEHTIKHGSFVLLGQQLFRLTLA